MGLSHAICRFVLLPSAVGIMCCACSYAGELAKESSTSGHTDGLGMGLGADRKNADGIAGQTAASFENADAEVAPRSAAAREAEASATRSAALSAQSAAYQEGINLASSAYSLSQSAISPDDWGLVASRWQRASEQLKLISDASEHYAIAQTKIAEYALNAQYASDRVVSLQAAALAPLPNNTVTRTVPSRLSETAIQPSPGAIAPSTPPSTPPQPSLSRSGVQPTAADAAAANAARRSTYSPAEADSAASTVRVPVVRRLHGTPVVRVTFNDARTYEMILDTGASRTLITREMADALGVVPNDRMIAATASAAQVAFDLGQMRSISVGAVRLNNAQISIGDSIDIGLLGNDFLAGYDVTIRDREVELTPAL